MPRPDTDEFFGLVYTELRRLAAQHLRRERSNHTLQPTVSHIPTGDFIMGATKRIFGCRLIRAGIVLAGLGMASGQQPAPASKAASPSKATKQVSIIDPVLQMEAYSFQIPANWIFEGTMVPGPSCAPVQNAVYRAVSPDGFSQSKALPGVSWQWLCEGQIDRINGVSHHNAAVLNEAVQKFEEAQQALPGSPDPELGLAGVYVYGLKDIDKAYAALQEAERHGY